RGRGGARDRAHARLQAAPRVPRGLRLRGRARAAPRGRTARSPHPWPPRRPPRRRALARAAQGTPARGLIPRRECAEGASSALSVVDPRLLFPAHTETLRRAHAETRSFISHRDAEIAEKLPGRATFILKPSVPRRDPCPY